MRAGVRNTPHGRGGPWLIHSYPPPPPCVVPKKKVNRKHTNTANLSAKYTIGHFAPSGIIFHQIEIPKRPKEIPLTKKQCYPHHHRMRWVGFRCQNNWMAVCLGKAAHTPTLMRFCVPKCQSIHFLPTPILCTSVPSRAPHLCCLILVLQGGRFG